MSKEELCILLERYSIPLHEWGKGEAKTFDDLLEEINAGESTFLEQEGRLIRLAKGVVIDVYYRDGAKVLVLCEERQVFADGRSRVRVLGASIGEKMKLGETPEETALRALAEELGITEKLQLFAGRGSTKGPTASVSFPGIWTVHTMQRFHVFLSERWYRLDGYREEQAGKTSYFVWKEFASI